MSPPPPNPALLPLRQLPAVLQGVVPGLLRAPQPLSRPLRRLARENPGPRPPSLPRLRGPRMACGPSSPPAAHLRFPDHPLRRLPRAAAPPRGHPPLGPGTPARAVGRAAPRRAAPAATPRFAVVMSTPLPPATLPPSAMSPAPLVDLVLNGIGERALPPRLPPGAGGVF